MPRPGPRPRVLVPIVALLALAAACSNSASDRELARISSRLDSFAVTLTAVTTALSRGSGPTGPTSATVGVAGAASLGLATAPVTIVEFTDYQCPFCARHATQTLAFLKREYIEPGKVRYVIRDLPLTELHPIAARAAGAARCAGAQSESAYWAYHDALFEAQKGLADSTLTTLAMTAGLNADAFGTCLSANRFTTVVEEDAAEARAAGLGSTPAFVIGQTPSGDSLTGKVLLGAYHAITARLRAPVCPEPRAFRMRGARHHRRA